MVINKAFLHVIDKFSTPSEGWGTIRRPDLVEPPSLGAAQRHAGAATCYNGRRRMTCSDDSAAYAALFWWDGSYREPSRSSAKITPTLRLASALSAFLAAPGEGLPFPSVCCASLRS